VTTKEAKEGPSGEDYVNLYSHKRAEKVLGIKFIDGIQSGIEMAYDMIKRGDICKP